ncbi:MAG: Ig-like domain-containing protein [Planctomycetes bacterium]|nr:Ig-like domain-containing protein [Planctomycetota bacterium]
MSVPSPRIALFSSTIRRLSTGPAWAAAALALLAGCWGGDNGGSAFGFPGGGPGGGGGGGVDPATPTDGAQSAKGAPKIVDVQPSGNQAVDVSTPIVVTFSESMQVGRITSANLIVRPEGATSGVGGSFLVQASGRLATFFPASPLAPATNYEVLVTAELADLDGFRVNPGTDGIVGRFRTAATGTTPSFRVLAIFPPTQPSVGASSAKNIASDAEVVIVFSEAIDTGTTFPTGLVLGVADVNTPAGQLPFTITDPYALAELSVDYPSSGGGRVGVFRPLEGFDPGVFIGIVATPALRSTAGRALAEPAFGSFQVLPFRAPDAVRVPTTPANSINRANREAVPVEVDVDATALAGDTVALTIQESAGSKLARFSKRLDVDGAQVVSFTAKLTDNAGANLLADGSVSFAAALSRRGLLSSYRVQGGVVQDTVVPSVLTLGPPTGTSQTAFLTTLGDPAIYGTSSERVVSVTVTGANVPSPPTTPASTDGNFFVLQPVSLGLRAGAEPISITVSDAAGNEGVAQVGEILQRGVITGDTTGGTLIVQVYDADSFAALSQIDVQVEDGPPGSAPASRRFGLTDVRGEASFTVTAGGRHTITIGRTGFNLTTLVDTGAGFCSLPLERTVRSSGSLAGAITRAGSTFQGIEDVRFCFNLDADSRGFAQRDIENPTGPLASLPATTVAPGRLQYTTAFLTFLPAQTGSVVASFRELIGLQPVVAGGQRSIAISLPASPPTSAPWGPLALDFSGIPTPPNFASNLAAPPRAKSESAVTGFDGAPTFGIGGPSGTAPTFTVGGTFVAPSIEPARISENFLVADATDLAGNFVRSRPTFAAAVTAGSLSMPALPHLQSGGGTYPFAYSFTDTLGQGFYRVRFTDSDPVLPRSWLLLVPDGSAGTVATRVPDLGPSFTRLRSGNWVVSIEALGMAAGFSMDGFLLSDGDRFYRSLARPGATTIAVN